MPNHSTITESDVADLVGLMDEAADSYMRGEIRHYLSLFDHPDEFTLMPPYGGETSHGFSYSDEAVAETSAFFTSGEATLELEKSYVSGEMVVMVAVERQHGEVGGMPDQDWSLRVTLVFRRSGERWELLHRHADPLVQSIPMEHCAQLARGLGT